MGFEEVLGGAYLIVAIARALIKFLDVFDLLKLTSITSSAISCGVSSNPTCTTNAIAGMITWLIDFLIGPILLLMDILKFVVQIPIIGVFLAIGAFWLFGELQKS